VVEVIFQKTPIQFFWNFNSSLLCNGHRNVNLYSIWNCSGPDGY
jgi:hypothetical protein